MIVRNVEINGRSGPRVALGCEYQGQRYHVWIDPSTGCVGHTLYKNPPLSARPGDPAHYRTRKLSVDSQFSQRLIAIMRDVMVIEGLVEKFCEQERQEAARLEAATAAAKLEERKRQAAPRLHQALAALTDYCSTIDVLPTEPAIVEARAVLAEIEGVS